jgi:23S rRNA (pseudouridine1915-N3)-methyltransferase
MKIIIATVGKAKKTAEAELVARYLKQTRWDVTLKEIPDAPSGLPSAERKRWEAEKIAALLDADTRLIALDGNGEQLTSPQFAQLISGAQSQYVKRLLFAIGGQDGLDTSLLGEAKRIIAFGKATWPHQLVRALLAEQVYRAYTLSIGHPYHSGH